ncbi:EamA family transporter RarD [Curtobacterium sp. MCLR17_059]|nr:EamA family transporter RarD [Curtobacterium flaccumfaciens]PZE32759.1 EamA family transporter RarD [Curtobacterium sp. MCLR17_055]PZE60672.1 EamA family transporter RarD [Curtobacterium sp. MCLR17_044]PZE72833.1 EamA family transporter RarD [Curtobacterium sp. MCLR17_059]PZF30422.1 EamA family transporter RarD [Curtobacterium sp. MCLR17_045]PZF56001.1 EamA family transporter RarD [Curtobacterium sp. MCLR17_057]TSD12983.1 EamA family transporter RarD [Curtobacterium sp. KBS0715]
MVQAIVAYGLWGLMPLLFAAMAPAAAFEIVSWRIVFGLVFCAVAIAVTRSWLRTRTLMAQRRVMLVMGLAAVLILVNWTVYVLATTTGHTVEAALGYFINPLVTIALGVVVLRERLRPAQWAAVGLSVVAVVVIAIGYGQMPWISLALAFSFGLYGLVKKRVGGTVDALSGLTIETVWLLPIAVVALVVLGVTGLGGGVTFTSEGWGHAVITVLTGPATAVPLLLFASSARRVSLSTLGLTQYLAPVMQLLVGVLVQHEEMSAGRWFGFGIVWLALVVLTADSFAAARASRRRALAPTQAEPV